MSYLPGYNYVKNAAGVWTPVGYSSGDAQLPISNYGGTIAQGARPDGYLNTRPDPSTLMFDTFETVDTTNTWTLYGVNPPTGANGVLTLNANVTANGSSYARSQPAFTPGSNAFLQASMLVTIAAAVQTGNTRWWGLGVPTGTPSVTIPLTNGVVFETRSADGLLYGSVYSGSALTQSVALTRPTDGTAHRYQITYKASRVYFNIDNVEVGSIPFPNPQIQALPMTIGSVNGGTALGAAATLNANLMGLSDTGKNQIAISDGQYPWREAKVSATGGLSIKGTGLPAQTGSVAAGNNSTTIGPWDVSEANNGTFFVKNTIAASAFAGAPVLVFEQSDDNVSWSPMQVARADGVLASTHTLPANAANASIVFNAMIIGANWIRIRATTGPTTNGLTVVFDPGTMPFVPAVVASGPPMSTSTLSSPALAVASFTILAANVNRKMATFFNDSVNVVYLAFAATASTTAYTVQIPASGYYELPGTTSVYTGVITGISTVATGNVRVTEMI